MDLITGHLQTLTVTLSGPLKNAFQVRARLQRAIGLNNLSRADGHGTFSKDAPLATSNITEKETVDPQTIDYSIWIVHIRPEIREDVEFLSTYKARESRGKQFVEEMFAKAFKVAHPSWIIKKVTVEAKP